MIKKLIKFKNIMEKKVYRKDLGIEIAKEREFWIKNLKYFYKYSK